MRAEWTLVVSLEFHIISICGIYDPTVGIKSYEKSYQMNADLYNDHEYIESCVAF
jgi:hypothetical protein